MYYTFSVFLSRNLYSPFHYINKPTPLPLPFHLEYFFHLNSPQYFVFDLILSTAITSSFLYLLPVIRYKFFLILWVKFTSYPITHLPSLPSHLSNLSYVSVTFNNSPTHCTVLDPRPF